MNRASRRRLNKEKDKTDKVYHAKYGELKTHVDKMVDEKKDEFIADASLKVVAGTLLTLNAEFGFGKKRIKQFMEGFNYLYSEISEGSFSFEDVQIELENLGVNLEYK